MELKPWIYRNLSRSNNIFKVQFKDTVVPDFRSLLGDTN